MGLFLYHPPPPHRALPHAITPSPPSPHHAPTLHHTIPSPPYNTLLAHVAHQHAPRCRAVSVMNADECNFWIKK